MANEIQIAVRAQDFASPTMTRVKGNAAGLRRELESHNGVLASVRSGWLGLGTVLAGAGITVAGITAGFGKLIGAASDMAETQSKVNAVFKEGAADILAWGEGSAEAIGLSEQAALAAASTYGNLFDSLGLTRDASIEMSKGVVQLAADLASFNNVEIGEALTALQSGLVGETEPMRRFGVAINAATVEAAALKLGLAATKEEITESDKVTARYALIMDQTRNAQGDFARTSDGLANSQRTLRAQVSDVAAALGKELEPYARDVVQALSDWIDLHAEDAIDTFATAVEGAIVFVKDLQKLLDLLVNSAPYVITVKIVTTGLDVLSATASGLSGLAGGSKDLLSGIGSTLKGLAPTGIPNLPQFGRGLLDDIGLAASAKKPVGPLAQVNRAVNPPEFKGYSPAQLAAAQEDLDAAGASRGADLMNEVKQAAGAFTASLSDVGDALSGSKGSGGGASLKTAAEELAERLAEAAEITADRNMQLANKAMREAEEAARALAEQHDRLAEAERKREQELLANANAAAGFAQRVGATSLGSQAAIAQMFGFAPPELNVTVP